MLARVTKARVGLSKYLMDGLRNDWKGVDRTMKDDVIPVVGDLDLFAKTEQYLNDKKNYKYNYMHITLSFNDEDTKRLYDLPEDQRDQVMEGMVNDYVKHHFSGYDLENEVIYYAERHRPKIKLNEKGDKRYEHIHIAIALYNPLNDTQLRPAFTKSPYMDSVLQSYVNKKYGLTNPRDYKRDSRKDSQIAKDRRYYISELSDINNHNELIDYFNNNNIEYKEIKTKSNHYYKIINPNGKDINLRGKGFEHLQKMTIDKNWVYPEKERLEKLEAILSSFYEKRIEQITGRESKETRAKKEEIYKDIHNDSENAIAMSYQQKIFYRHYKHLIDRDLKGYFVDTKNDKEVKFINAKKNIKVIDKGDKITTDRTTDNLSEKVSLMIDIAEAKGWSLPNLQINGSDAFKAEVKRQIAQRLREQEIAETKTLSLTAKAVAVAQAEKRPTNPIDKEITKEIDTKEAQKADDNIDIKLLKQALPAKIVLEYAVEKYGIDPSEYEVVEDNKINNKTNRQKPKNIIDFLQKEIHISTKEAIAQCEELYATKPLAVDATQQQDVKEIKEKGGLTMPLSISICKDTKPNALTGWEQVEVKSYSELATLMQQYPYSEAMFKNGYRKGDNVEGLNNLIIYDIDNDPDTPQLTIDEARALLSKHGISAMIIPSKSHQIEKFTKGGESKGIADRYRIVIPTNKSFDAFDDREKYKEFQQITAKALGIDKYVDEKALNDRARFYYKSPITAKPIVIQADRVMNIDRLEEVAINRIDSQRAEREAERKRIAEIRANIAQHRSVSNNAGKALSYANAEAIINIPIDTLIKKFEGGQEYSEGSYHMVKTDTAKYSIVEENVAHDFKSDTTYNSLTYLQHQLGTTNLNQIAREAEKITGESYILTNTKAVEEAVKKAMKAAVNDKSFEEAIKQEFGVKFCKLDKDSIKIADREVSLGDIGLQKSDLIDGFKSNREAVKKAEENAKKIEQSEEMRQQNSNSHFHGMSL